MAELSFFNLQANVTDDTGYTLATSYITSMQSPTCSWDMYSIDNFLIPAVLRSDTDQTVAEQVAATLQRGPVAAAPTMSPAPISAQSPLTAAGTINS